MSQFEQEHANFLQHHLQRRKGERTRRLQEGHAFAEKLFLQQVWWKAFGHFHNLHPEYEVKDFKDGTRFIDFAYIHRTLRLAIEIDGYGPHSANIGRNQFSDQWIRQNHLIIDGWKILRFSFDDVKERPRMCQQMVQQFMGRYLAQISMSQINMTSQEKEVLRLGLQLERELVPRDVCDLLEVHHEKARQILQTMVQKQIVAPAGRGTQRIRRYRIQEAAMKQWLEQ